MTMSVLDLLLESPSSWEQQAPPMEASMSCFPSMCDIAIIGGGITGLSAALAAANQGMSVVLLEMHYVGAGASGKNSGFVVPIPSRLSPSDLKNWLGDTAKPYMSALKESAQSLLAIKKAGAVNKGWMQVSDNDVNINYDNLSKQWAELGVDTNYLKGDGLHSAIGSEAYSKGLLLEGGGQIDPLLMARNMADQCRAAGVEIIEDCAVTNIETQGDGSHVIFSSKGVLVSKNIIMAGNAYSKLAISSIEKSTAKIPLVLAEFDLSDREYETLLPLNIPFSDTYKDMWFYRKGNQKTLITGMFSASKKYSLAGYEDVLRKRAAATFDVMPGSLNAIWGGMVGLTFDGLPKIYQLDKTIYAWTGCNGRGLALSHLMGKFLTSKIVGSPTLDLPVAYHKPFYFRQLMELISQCVVSIDRNKRTSCMNGMR